MSNLVEMREITKSFGSFVANDHIHLNVKENEILALLGENGAGKSTLMNILYGLYKADSGDVLLRGEKVDIRSPKDAIDLGIGMVHQHFMLIKPFTVLENLILGSEPVNHLKIDFKKARQEVRDLSDEYGMALDPDAFISDISVGMQQRVEIVKVLMRGAKLVIFDEPTAVLTPQEIEDFYRICRDLKAKGHTIIIITHKLKEIKELADRVTVIRKGKNVCTEQTSLVSETKLAELMVGYALEEIAVKKKNSPGDDVFVMREVHSDSTRGNRALKGISLKVRAGEIVGIAGVEGNGQTELALIINRLLNYSRGEIVYRGTPYSKNLSTKQLIEKGVGHIPEDRHARGLVKEFSVVENLILGMHASPHFSRAGFMKKAKVIEHGALLCDEFDVRCASNHVIGGSLSGGNQQKMILAREISRQPSFIVVCQPTRGVDAVATQYIHAKLQELRNAQCAVLLISYDLDEIMSLSDRILTIFDGRIIGEYVNDGHVSRETIGLSMAGKESVEQILDGAK